MLHSQRATNYKSILQMIFPSTIYKKKFKYSEKQIKKKKKINKIRRTTSLLLLQVVTLIADLQQRWGGKARRWKLITLLADSRALSRVMQPRNFFFCTSPPSCRKTSLIYSHFNLQVTLVQFGGVTITFPRLAAEVSECCSICVHALKNITDGASYLVKCSSYNSTRGMRNIHISLAESIKKIK